jgi:hypothetical protein
MITWRKGRYCSISSRLPSKKISAKIFKDYTSLKSESNLAVNALFNHSRVPKKEEKITTLQTNTVIPSPPPPARKKKIIIKKKIRKKKTLQKKSRRRAKLSSIIISK